MFKVRNIVSDSTKLIRNKSKEVALPLSKEDEELCEYLMKYNQINGHSFIIDERLRGTSIHKKMLMFNYEYLKQFDIIWCAVEKDLKSHSYWKHLGFEEILSIDEAKFYIKPSSKELMLEIFIIKLLSERNEKNYNNCSSNNLEHS